MQALRARAELALTEGSRRLGAYCASLDRPALQELLTGVRAGKVDVIVVYKVDRLTRSLADFAKLVELFDAHSVPFVSVTQSFNTTSSMGRLTLNVLLSFAQFEREVIGERVRDKIAAAVGSLPNRSLAHLEPVSGAPTPKLENGGQRLPL